MALFCNLQLCTNLYKGASDGQKPLSAIENNISVVRMPSAMRKRGRPKGAGLTVIGLPDKKGKVALKPTALILKSEWEKTRGQLTMQSCSYMVGI